MKEQKNLVTISLDKRERRDPYYQDEAFPAGKRIHRASLQSPERIKNPAAITISKTYFSALNTTYYLYQSTPSNPAQPVHVNSNKVLVPSPLRCQTSSRLTT